MAEQNASAALTEVYVWELRGGSTIVFAPCGDVIHVDHASRSHNSYGFIGLARTRAAAEILATQWLSDHGLKRLAVADDDGGAG
jgi:hypothetical protein